MILKLLLVIWTEQTFILKSIKGGSQEEEALEIILLPMIRQLQELRMNFPLTIIYLKLRFCGFAYRLFEYHMGVEQYHPVGADAIPGNRLFAQYHSPQTEQMKKEILGQLLSCQSHVRILFATVAIGMGVNIPNIRHIIHIGVPGSVQQYFQEVGRCGRDGKPSKATLYFNNRDIAKNRVGVNDHIRQYCRSSGNCLREQLLKFLDAPERKFKVCGHLCCSVCHDSCTCDNCLISNQITPVNVSN